MNKDKLIIAQDKYIKFLGKELSRHESFIVVKSYMAPSTDVIKKGIELRTKIDLAKNE